MCSFCRDRILKIDSHYQTVTVEAGVRLGTLVTELAEHGFELVGNYDQMERTVGGAVASPCLGPGIGSQSALLSTQAISMKMVTATGKVMKVSQQQKHLLNAVRLSYGMLGAIYQITLRVRPIATFSANHRSMTIDTFADVANGQPVGDVGECIDRHAAMICRKRSNGAHS